MEQTLRKRFMWSEQEIEILKENFKSPIKWDTLLTLLPLRTRDCIHKKAQQLKLNPYRYVYVGSQGYLVKGTYRNRSSKLYLHRIIYENYYHVVLTSNDIIHHVDGDKTNNAISNLIRMSRSEHIKLHKDLLTNARASKKR